MAPDLGQGPRNIALMFAVAERPPTGAAESDAMPQITLMKRPAGVTRLAGAAAIAATVATMSVVSPAPEASADYTIFGSNVSWAEISWCAGHPVQCAVAKDAEDWATRVTAWKFPQDPKPHETAGDAFRHCAWNGAMSQRLGRAGALEVSENHEVAAATRQTAEEGKMDRFNNRQGAAIGEMANAAGVSDTWGYVLDTCLSMATNGGLWVNR